MNFFSKAISTMCFSISSMVTGGWLMPSTQLLSQGAGQMRPVNSGKLLVEASISYASFHCWRYTASLNSGMTLPRGHPLWQKGMPQFIHLADCLFNSWPDQVLTNSLES